VTTPYQLLDPLPPDVYEALKADIAETGMVYPVVLDETGAVLDGHHRKRIAEELGIEYPATVLPGLTEEEKVDRSLALNLTGRKQTREEKRETIRRYLLRRPEVSDRHAAQVTGASAATVASVRTGLESTAQIEQLAERVGEDGRTRRKPRSKAAPDPEAVARRQTEIAKSRDAAAKQQAKRDAERAEAEALTIAHMAPGATTSRGRTPARVLATQDRIRAALTDCIVALTRALQDPGLDEDLAAADAAQINDDARLIGATRKVRKLTAELDTRVAELKRATQSSRTERESPVRE
jgi:ParB-like chromosome segregation protein Spo0J